MYRAWCAAISFHKFLATPGYHENCQNCWSALITSPYHTITMSVWLHNNKCDVADIVKPCSLLLTHREKIMKRSRAKVHALKLQEFPLSRKFLSSTSIVFLSVLFMCLNRSCFFFYNGLAPNRHWWDTTCRVCILAHSQKEKEILRPLHV